MAQIYNYLLQSYQPFIRQVNYPARKGNELRKIYGSIINISRRSPFFKINLSKENQEYTIGIKEAAISLKSKLGEISDNDNPCFQSKDISVSNEKIISAKLLNKDTDKIPQNITLKIDNLATGQLNRGNEIYENSHGIATGNYEFDVKVLNQIYSLNFEQNEKTINIDTMNHIADYLNQSVPGINAYVESGNHNNYSNMVVSSEITGNQGDRNLILSDKEGFHKGVVEYFDLNNMEIAATNANFEINDIQKETTTNSFTIENTLSVTLLSSSDEPVTIKVIPDSKQILDQMKSVINTYNSLLNLAKEHAEASRDHYRAKKLITEIKSVGIAYQDELEACGLKFDDNGMLTTDVNLTQQAAVDGGMESLFTRENGFTEKLQEKMDAIIINPMDYLDKIIITYPGNDRTSFANPYVTSVYSGMLFNSYC